nr:ATP-binding cassette domain-containing protein [Gemmatimonadota bacterium]
MIEVEHLTQHYGLRPILRDVSLSVTEGEILVVMGPNGSGKTTLLATVGGVHAPQVGTVRIGGKVRRASVEEELAIRRQAVYLPDQLWMPRLRTGREWLLSVGKLYGIPDLQLMEHAGRLLDLFDLTSRA